MASRQTELRVIKWDLTEPGLIGPGQGSKRGGYTIWISNVTLEGSFHKSRIKQRGFVSLQKLALFAAWRPVKDTNTRYYESQADKDSVY